MDATKAPDHGLRIRTTITLVDDWREIVADTYLWALKRQLLREADMFDHPEDYRAGVEDTFAVLFPDSERGWGSSRSEDPDDEHQRRENPPAELWLG